MSSRARFAVAIVLALALALAFGGGGPACRCSRDSDSAREAAAPSEPSVVETPARTGGIAGGLSAPIAAARGENGEVFVAGLDVAAAAIRVQRISQNDEVVADKTVLAGIAWSSESELRMVPAAGGVAITWRGLRARKLVRQLLVLGPDLAPRGEPRDVAAASCATQDALWFIDGDHAEARPWAGSPARSALPKDKDASLVCGAHRAFALLDEDNGTSMIMLGSPGASTKAGVPVALLQESELGDDEQRERAEFTVGDDVGVVRLATSGTVMLREVKGGTKEPLRKLKTTVPRDADVVAVDASPRVLSVIFTEEDADACSKSGQTVTGASIRVKALRVDRATFEESVVELAPGACGRELGPFFTGSLGDSVSVAWVERVPAAGKARAPIAGLVHRTVPPAGAPGELARIEQPADALVDAGCDGKRCYAVALARRPKMDAMVPGLARVIRY
jgi:hypothetical protein